MYDLLIVGSGIYGSVFAHEANKAGKSVLVIDKRSHIGGNCYTECNQGIHQHIYGPHCFNTNSKQVWSYINQFSNFDSYTHRIKVNYHNHLYSFPINLFTLHQLWGCTTAHEAECLLKQKRLSIDHPNNLEEWLLSQVGEELYQTFYEGYSSKQWGCNCRDIPCDIGKRIPIRLNFDDRYHETKYSGIPSQGYTAIFEKLLDGIEVKLNENIKEVNWRPIAKTLVYTGAIDELFDYKYGTLTYRSLRFETHVKDVNDFQGTVQINYTDKDIPYTRVVEHKWFQPKTTEKTIVTYEFPDTWEPGKERYYPINNLENQQLYQKYLQDLPSDIIGGGRMFLNKYLDMDATIAIALKDVKKYLNIK